MKKYQHSLLLFTLLVFAIMSFGAAAAAAEKTDTVAVQAEPLKKIFNDVATTDNNAIFINYLADLKIMSGYPDGSFKAKEGLTRAQAAVVLAKAAGLQTPADSQSGFADVKTDHWAAGAIAAAAQAGYLKGYPDGSYHPEEKLTRAQGIALVMRLSKQEKHDELPVLKDMPKNHWAAPDMATALNAGMIGLSEDKTEVHPEAIMTRGSLARALGTLLTRDPGLYTKTLAGTIKDITGEIKLTRNGTTTTLQNEAPVFKGDVISVGASATANLVYPDGSSVLIKENTEFQIKESIGRAYIRQDGTSGIAVDNVNIDLKTGTLFGALATKQETTPEKQQAQNGETLLAAMDGLGYIAETAKTPPWYQQAEAKKVKMKVDMPYGVAAIRGTFILVTVNQDGSCNVSCLTGDAEVGGKSGGTVPLPGGKSSGINQGGTVAPQVPLTEKDKQEFSAVQQWVVNTALQIDQNKEAKVELVLEIPDQTISPAQQAQNTIDVVLKALESSGIQLTEQVINELKEKLITISEQNPVPSSPSGSPGTEETTVNYINYATVDGTFGPESSGNAQTISKNVIISAPGIKLRNMIISKDLTLAAGIGEGDVTLENVQVQGETKILGGGSNSVNVINCDLYMVTVDKDEVRIVAKGTSRIGALTLNTGATLEEGDDLTGDGFSVVSTGYILPAGAKIIISGNFEEVSINAPGLEIEVESGSIAAMSIAPTATGAQLNLLPGTSVNTLQINAQASIEGTGQIGSAEINAVGVQMVQAPLIWILGSGVGSVSIAGQVTSENGSSGALLSNLELDSGNIALNPAFNPLILSYTVEVNNEVSSISLIPTVLQNGASIKVKENPVASGTASSPINLNVGDNTITVEVANSDGSIIKTYNITVKREQNPVYELVRCFYPDMSEPGGIGLDAAGNIYFADYVYEDEDDHVIKMNAGGQKLSEIDLDAPITAVAASSDGETLYVATDDGNSPQVCKFISDDGIVFDSDEAFGDGGRLYLDEREPIAIALANGEIYVAESGGYVQIFAADSGQEIDNSELSGFSYPVGLAVDNSGSIYVADTDTNKVQKYDSSKNLLWEHDVIGLAGIALDGTGNVYVNQISQENWSVSKYDSVWTLITQFSDAGNASAFGIDSNGAAYILDRDNYCIYKYLPPAFTGVAELLTEENDFMLGPGTEPVTIELQPFDNLPAADQWEYRLSTTAFTPPLRDSVDAMALELTDGNISINVGQHLLLLNTDAGGRIKGYADIIIQPGQVAGVYGIETIAAIEGVCESNFLTFKDGIGQQEVNRLRLPNEPVSNGYITLTIDDGEFLSNCSVAAYVYAGDTFAGSELVSRFSDPLVSSEVSQYYQASWSGDAPDYIYFRALLPGADLDVSLSLIDTDNTGVGNNSNGEEVNKGTLEGTPEESSFTLVINEDGQLLAEVLVPYSDDDENDQLETMNINYIAVKAADALNADTTIMERYIAMACGNNVYLQSIMPQADRVLTIDIKADDPNNPGVTAANPGGTQEYPGEVPVFEVNSLTVHTALAHDGYLLFKFEEDNETSRRNIAVSSDSTIEDIAGLICDGLELSGYTVENKGNGSIDFISTNLGDRDVEISLIPSQAASSCTTIELDPEGFLEWYASDTIMNNSGYQNFTINDMLGYIFSSDGSQQDYKVFDSLNQLMGSNGDPWYARKLQVTAEDGSIREYIVRQTC